MARFLSWQINIEGEQDFDEDKVVKEVTDCIDISTDSEDSTSDTQRHEDIPPETLKILKVSYFKKELKNPGQLTVGLNKVVLEILELTLKNTVSLAATTTNKNQFGNKINGFEINEYREVIKPN